MVDGSLSFVTLVNDHEQFARSRASLERSGVESPSWTVVEPNRLGWNAARGLNHGLDQARTTWVACVHQDVLFPKGWIATVSRQLALVPDSVAVVGLVGTRTDHRFRGHIVDPNGHGYWGPLPARVLLADEVLLLVRRDSGLRFDDGIPGFHCYGTDLCLQARARGLDVMVVDAPIRHLSTGRLDEAYDRAARVLLDRWGEAQRHILAPPAALIVDRERASALELLLVRWKRRRDRSRRDRPPAGVQLEW